MSVLIAIFVALPVLGFLFSAGGCCCGNPCTNCSSGSASSQVQIEISGVTGSGGSCGSCSSVNGVWVYDYAGQLTDSYCSWSNFSIPCYVSSTFFLYPPGFNVFGGDFSIYKMGVSLTGATVFNGQNFWKLFDTDKPDCDFEAENLPNKNTPSSPRCNFSAATMTVTAA